MCVPLSTSCWAWWRAFADRLRQRGQSPAGARYRTFAGNRDPGGLGAGRGRIVRQFLTESLLLALFGGVAGLVLGAVGVRALLAVNPGGVPRIGPEGAAVGWMGPCSALPCWSRWAPGFSSAWRPRSTPRVRPQCHAEGRQRPLRLGLRQNKVRSLLVITEIALRHDPAHRRRPADPQFHRTAQRGPRFRCAQRLTMDTALTGSRYDHTAGHLGHGRQVIQRVDAIPGVETAAASLLFAARRRLGAGLRHPRTSSYQRACARRRRLELRHQRFLRSLQGPAGSRTRFHRPR